MPNAIKDLFSSSTAMTISLGSLASSTSNVGRQSTMIDNSTTRYGRLLVFVKAKLGTSPTGNRSVQVYLLRGDGLGNRDDAAGANDAAITLLNAVPIGALVTFGAASNLLTAGQHGSTFGGNPFATAIGDAVLAEIEHADLVGNARVQGEAIRAAIAAIGSPLVAEVRGAGLLLGVVLSEPVAGAVSAAAMRNGLIVNAANESVIRLAPPLIIGAREVEQFARRFGAALAEVEAELAAQQSTTPKESA